MGPLALGPQLCPLYPLCFSWGKSGCKAHPINTAIAPRGPSRSILETGEFLSPWKDNEEPQSPRCSWDLEGRAWKKGTLHFCLALAAF